MSGDLPMDVYTDEEEEFSDIIIDEDEFSFSDSSDDTFSVNDDNDGISIYIIKLFIIINFLTIIYNLCLLTI